MLVVAQKELSSVQNSFGFYESTLYTKIRTKHLASYPSGREVFAS